MTAKGDYAAGTAAKFLRGEVTVDLNTGQLTGLAVVAEVYGAVSGELLTTKTFKWNPSDPADAQAAALLWEKAKVDVLNEQGLELWQPPPP